MDNSDSVLISKAQKFAEEMNELGVLAVIITMKKEEGSLKCGAAANCPPELAKMICSSFLDKVDTTEPLNKEPS